jgi:ketosteroid isomerase-like protein
LADWLIARIFKHPHSNAKSQPMKRIALIIMTVHLSVCLHAQQPLTKDQQEVQQAIIGFFEALSNRDSISLRNHSTADVALFEYGSIWNLDTLIRKAITINTSTDFKRKNTFYFNSTKVNKNTAWVSYYLRSDITGNGRQSVLQWLESIVAVREKKTWKIASLHSTLIKRS